MLFPPCYRTNYSSEISMSRHYTNNYPSMRLPLSSLKACYIHSLVISSRNSSPTIPGITSKRTQTLNASSNGTQYLLHTLLFLRLLSRPVGTPSYISPSASTHSTSLSIIVTLRSFTDCSLRTRKYAVLSVLKRSLGNVAINASRSE